MQLEHPLGNIKIYVYNLKLIEAAEAFLKAIEKDPDATIKALENV